MEVDFEGEDAASFLDSLDSASAVLFVSGERAGCFVGRRGRDHRGAHGGSGRWAGLGCRRIA